MENNQDLQNKVDSMLNRGLIFSIVWLAGVGSIISIILANKARKIIKRSNGQLEGMDTVWPCFALGGFGLLFWALIIIGFIISLITN